MTLSTEHLVLEGFLDRLLGPRGYASLHLPRFEDNGWDVQRLAEIAARFGKVPSEVRKFDVELTMEAGGRVSVARRRRNGCKKPDTQPLLLVANG